VCCSMSPHGSLPCGEAISRALRAPARSAAQLTQVAPADSDGGLGSIAFGIMDYGLWAMEWIMGLQYTGWYRGLHSYASAPSNYLYTRCALTRPNET